MATLSELVTNAESEKRWNEIQVSHIPSQSWFGALPTSDLLLYRMVVLVRLKGGAMSALRLP